MFRVQIRIQNSGNVAHDLRWLLSVDRIEEEVDFAVRLPLSLDAVRSCKVKISKNLINST